MCDGTFPHVSSAQRRGMWNFGRTWVTSLGRTRCRVLLPATASFPRVGEPLCGGTCSRAVGG